MKRLLRSTFGIAALSLLVTACQKEFNTSLYPNHEDLYLVGMDQLAKRKWDNAAKAFDQLTRTLPVRDSLLPLSYFYLGEAQSKNREHLLSATSYYRLAEVLPEDTLADDALLRSGIEYARMWKRPDLDPQYGQSAINTLSTLISLYPESPYVAEADSLIWVLENKFAEKDFKTGYSYYRRRAYDSGIIYFKDVLRKYPDTKAARDASIYLLQSYQKIRYAADARDLCEEMRQKYPEDREVISRCGLGSSAEASTPPM